MDPAIRYGRGAGVGRGLAVGLGLAVALGVAVDVGVAVAVAVGEGVGVGPAFESDAWQSSTDCLPRFVLKLFPVRVACLLFGFVTPALSALRPAL